MTISQILAACSAAESAVTAWGNAQYAVFENEVNGDGYISGSDPLVQDAWNKYNTATSQINAIQPLCDAEHSQYANFSASTCAGYISQALSTLSSSVRIPSTSGQGSVQPSQADAWAVTAYFASTNANAPLGQLVTYANNQYPFTESPPSCSCSLGIADPNANTLSASYSMTNPPPSGGAHLMFSRNGGAFSEVNWNWASTSGSFTFGVPDDIITQDSGPGGSATYQAYISVQQSGTEAARSNVPTLVCGIN